MPTSTGAPLNLPLPLSPADIGRPKATGAPKANPSAIVADDSVDGYCMERNCVLPESNSAATFGRFISCNKAAKRLDLARTSLRRRRRRQAARLATNRFQNGRAQQVELTGALAPSMAAIEH